MYFVAIFVVSDYSIKYDLIHEDGKSGGMRSIDPRKQFCLQKDLGEGETKENNYILLQYPIKILFMIT